MKRTKGQMTEEDLQFSLQELIEAWQGPMVSEDGEKESDVERSETFREAGILSNNKGLVVRLEDGSEFQITIVRSR
jgi:hypothetical protein